MRTIQVPTALYAAIWADRQPGEETEAEILARRYNVARDAPKEPSPDTDLGFSDPKYGFKVDGGFSIFRVFKGKEYTACAAAGLWFYDGDGYASLNDLSIAIGAGGENAWHGWLFRDAATGEARVLSDLRDPSTIRRRK